MKNLSLIISCLLLTFASYAQCPNEVILESQADIATFLNDYPNCTDIPGNFRIGKSLAGSDQSDITDVSGLNNIVYVGSGLLIWKNPNLTSLNGLENITEVGGLFSLTDNNGLTTLSGLSGLTDIGGGLFIDNNYYLESLNGLGPVTEVGHRLYISNNIRLEDISALSSLVAVEENLDIRINLELTNLDGLQQVASVGGDLILMDNHLLTNLDALDHTMTIGGTIKIKNNSELSNCAVSAVCEYIELNGFDIVEVSNNNTDCNSESDIWSFCEGVGLEDGLSDFINVFPNPVRERLMVSSEGVLIDEIRLLDIAGKVILRQKEMVVDMIGMDMGVYFLEVHTEQGTLLEKIIVL